MKTPPRETQVGHSYRRRRNVAVAAALCTALALGACGDDASSSTPSTLQTGSTLRGADRGPLVVDSDGVSRMPGDAVTDQLDALPKSQLSQSDRDSLAFMREEERLAEDVYRVLYAKWKLAIFDNIAAAETTHTASVKALLDRYQLPDPTAGKPAGTYQNATIQSIYTALVTKGTASLVDALTVGATIEDLDIADVEKLMAATENADLDLVYGNLARGSRNHLRSFVAQVTAAGGSYTPQYITADAYAQIIASGRERGGNAGRMGRGTRGGGNGSGTGTCDGTGPRAGGNRGNGNGAGNGQGNGNRNGDGTGQGTGVCDGSGRP
jgi:hypothetical protein